MHKIIMLELEYGALYSSYTGMYRTVDTVGGMMKI